jgi:uncharacterized protein YoxC
MTYSVNFYLALAFGVLVLFMLNNISNSIDNLAKRLSKLDEIYISIRGTYAETGTNGFLEQINNQLASLDSIEKNAEFIENKLSRIEDDLGYIKNHLNT